MTQPKNGDLGRHFGHFTVGRHGAAEVGLTRVGFDDEVGAAQSPILLHQHHTTTCPLVRTSALFYNPLSDPLFIVRQGSVATKTGMERLAVDSDASKTLQEVEQNGTGHTSGYTAAEGAWSNVDFLRETTPQLKTTNMYGVRLPRPFSVAVGDKSILRA